MLDDFTRSHWFAIGRVEDFSDGEERETALLGTPLKALRTGDEVIVSDVANGLRSLPVQRRYGHVWTSLSDEPRPLYDMPEFDDPRRRLVTVGAVSVRCSGLRVIENFLDMAHFPFVHTGILGVEERSEVEEYQVDLAGQPEEVWATKCRFFLPQASASAKGGQMVEYKYRLPHPFSTILYRTSPTVEGVWDLIGLFIQPVAEDFCHVHSFVLMLDDETTDVGLLHFQQNIFLQDRMILENQVPRLLPLDPRKELPTRADASSIAFRRWLKDKGVAYGVEPLEAAA